MNKICGTNGEKRNAFRISVRKPERRDQQENQDIDGWIILSSVRVTVDGVWVGNRIYGTLIYAPRGYTSQTTITYKLLVAALLGSGFWRRTFPIFWVPELTPASVTQQLLLPFCTISRRLFLRN
jgi:hypothetical protein